MFKKSCGWWPIWYLLFFCHGGAEGQLQWVVKEKVTDYGQNLTLFCPVKNCCNEGAGWSVRSKTLLDVKAFSNNSNVKYHGTYNTDGFGVVIRNLSEADLNVTYRCVYDFNWSTPKYLLHGDVFKESTEVPDKDKENNTVAIEIGGYFFGAGAGICIVGGITIGIIAYCMRRKNKKQKSKGTGPDSKSLIDPTKPMENQQGTGPDSKSLIDPTKPTENQQGTGPDSKSLIDSTKPMENQQGTGPDSKSLIDPTKPMENQQDDMAEAESNIVVEAESNTMMHSDAQVVLEPFDAVRAMRNNLAVESELRIAIVGKTGVGKSATANTICGRNYFNVGFSAQAMTQICQQQKVTRLGKDISIIDTPGIFGAEVNQGDVEREIKRCVHLGAPGLHAILFVMEIGRVTQENITTLRTFLNFFGNGMENRVIVVFTHGDKLQKMGETLLNYLETIPWELRSFLKICQKRFLLFNNTLNKEQSNQQVSAILLLIETLKISNTFAFYTDDAFKKAEKRIQQREEEIRKKIQMKYNEDIKELQKEIRREKQKEIEELKKIYENKLGNVREEVRMEIKYKHNALFW